jgi:Sec-independent protein secretion pathway component TatC
VLRSSIPLEYDKRATFAMAILFLISLCFRNPVFLYASISISHIRSHTPADGAAHIYFLAVLLSHTTTYTCTSTYLSTTITCEFLFLFLLLLSCTLFIA